MMNTPPALSVVVPTYNRCSTLLVTLDKLARQTLAPKDFEVLVVDDGSTDTTLDAVESLIPAMPYRLRYFRHENRGPGFTENRGIREAHAPIVLIIADDIWATTTLLEQHLDTHRAYPQQHFAVLGKVVPSPELPPTVLHMNWDPFGRDFKAIAGKREVDSTCFFACNISAKTKFFLKNGLFKERRGAANEDIELGYRLGQKGLRILYNENALGYHHHVTELAKACRRAYEQGYNIGLLVDNIPKSIILPFCRIVSIEAGWKHFIWRLPRAILRSALFNRWSVEGFWCPVLESAENSRFAALFAHRLSYEFATGYFVRKGYKDMRWDRRRRADSRPEKV